jgi:hypothetical protein
MTHEESVSLLLQLHEATTFVAEEYFFDPHHLRLIAGPLELLSNLVFGVFWSCSDLVVLCGFNSVFEFDARDDFGQIVKAA